MDKEDIYINDWKRIFIGEVPGEFYIEVIIRIAVIYLIIMLSMRLMGKRMASQMNVTEFASLVSLAAAIGMGIQAPERGLLPALIVAMIIVFLQRLITSQTAKHIDVERYTTDTISTLVKDGVINRKALLKTDISKDKVFGKLRGSGIKHLGEVARLYVEASGKFTLIKNQEQVAGLSVIPAWDKAFRDRLHADKTKLVCCECGAEKAIDQSSAPCKNCNGTEAEPPVKS